MNFSVASKSDSVVTDVDMYRTFSSELKRILVLMLPLDKTAVFWLLERMLEFRRLLLRSQGDRHRVLAKEDTKREDAMLLLLLESIISVGL